MVPWERQQYWFWLSAILIVGGAASLHQNSLTVVESSTSGQAKASGERVHRTRETLRDQPVQKSIANAAPIAEASERTRDIFSGTATEIDAEKFPEPEPTDVFQADYHTRDATPQAASDSAILKASLIESVANSQARPVVWLVGSIESEHE